MKNLALVFALIIGSTALSGCVHKLVTVPAKVAYKTTKGVVKGTAAVVRAVVPGDSKKDDE